MRLAKKSNKLENFYGGIEEFEYCATYSLPGVLRMLTELKKRHSRNFSTITSVKIDPHKSPFLAIVAYLIRLAAPVIKTRNISTGTCSDFGKSLQLCTENCTNTNIEGKSGTCSMTIDLDVCTCKGRNSIVHEMKKYDMENGQEVSSRWEGSETGEQGYIGMCGTCVRYCRYWPGEIKVGPHLNETTAVFLQSVAMFCYGCLDKVAQALDARHNGLHNSPKTQFTTLLQTG